MSLQNRDRIYFLEVRVHDLEIENKRLKRLVSDLIEVVNVELKH